MYELKKKNFITFTPPSRLHNLMFYFVLSKLRHRLLLLLSLSCSLDHSSLTSPPCIIVIIIIINCIPYFENENLKSPLLFYFILFHFILFYHTSRLNFYWFNNKIVFLLCSFFFSTIVLILKIENPIIITIILLIV